MEQFKASRWFAKSGVNIDQKFYSLIKLWNEVLNDMYGKDAERKKSIYNIILSDENISTVSAEALKWLQRLAH